MFARAHPGAQISPAHALFYTQLILLFMYRLAVLDVQDAFARAKLAGGG